MFLQIAVIEQFSKRQLLRTFSEADSALFRLLDDIKQGQWKYSET
jgi:hypothetical protein